MTADSDSFERKLVAILSADAVGYSRLMNDDDEATIRALRAHQAAIERIVATFRGRVVDTPGDNLLAEFIERQCHSVLPAFVLVQQVIQKLVETEAPAVQICVCNRPVIEVRQGSVN